MYFYKTQCDLLCPGNSLLVNYCMVNLSHSKLFMATFTI